MKSDKNAFSTKWSHFSDLTNDTNIWQGSAILDEVRALYLEQIWCFPYWLLLIDNMGEMGGILLYAITVSFRK